MHMYDRDFEFAKNVAYGTMNTINQRLNIEKLIEYKDDLCNWIDNSFTNKDDFTKKLVDYKIICEDINE